ncbi:porin family protein [Mesorhizobium sp. M1C.F.Ca.ET.193.01.1.1]|uniref:outer membrane protein n=2 Tax=Mesorhizobium TaxID=68287 RepID=UPI000FD47BD1|nr:MULTISPECIES: outer membrane protein [unclassified Mesorhizobium]TGT00568.1 porin family protein [bacterium M00.F.Ca.ET.177.01.1.1]TGQ53983.1 porin family protein [Mesorhizobium sp. M1C.F.Ca.ET.210.01.1.1]TGQ72004.1 porin family protein [Mesorhizobium sp. M1C.F.Ca.ET.212.01.1.1]TGR08729.1 porin family protein [Mesorhizobium sp. M1C.F.Ca.ET.204.01.1.1]TGR29465.1 porin family protein [Mesorhizobium sp. M1C.F.Ca.ET.196.01.1.1]
MRHSTLASAGFLILLSGRALAADAGADLPMTAPGFDWTGYYAGLQAGYGWGSSDISGTEGEPFAASPDLDGGFVGGHVAGLWQFNQAVIGARAELNYSSIDGSALLEPGNAAGTEIKWLGSVDAEAGLAVDRWLIYGVGGVAFAGIETSQDAGPSFAKTRTSAGWTIGAGVDYALSNNIVVGAQYRYYDFGTEHFDVPDDFSDRDQDVKLHTLGVNFSYKF